MRLIRSHLGKIAVVGSVVGVTALIMLALPAELLAADGSSGWRPTFDLVMRWVNFLILAFVIVKFSRAPIKSFLEGKKQEIASQIEALEKEKEKIVQEIENGQQKLENSRDRLEQLKKKIIAEGEKNRQRIIRDAEKESKLLLEGAGQKMNSRIQEAKADLRAELVDLAASIAIQKLPAQMTDRDNQKFIDTFLAETTKKL